MVPLHQGPSLRTSVALKVRLEIAGPTLVPPFTPITLNITGTFESLQQYQAWVCT